MKKNRWFATISLVSLLAAGRAGAEDNPAAPGFDQAGSDPRAIAVADQVMARLGGRRNWDQTRYLTWRFFDKRRHVWDKWTGDLRFEEGDRLVLMNLNTRQGQAWKAGEKVADPDTLAAELDRAYRAWVNDSYWMFMPYKLKDTGVTLSYKGVGQTAAGRPADVLVLTFKDVGVTPQNKYEVYVDQQDHLVRQWAYFPQATDPAPAFVGPWDNWQQYGHILLSDERGERKHTEIAVFEALPPAVFGSPAPVDLMGLAGGNGK